MLRSIILTAHSTPVCCEAFMVRTGKSLSWIRLGTLPQHDIRPGSPILAPRTHLVHRMLYHPRAALSEDVPDVVVVVDVVPGG